MIQFETPRLPVIKTNSSGGGGIITGLIVVLITAGLIYGYNKSTSDKK